jgi:hypothetical protein
MTKQQKKQNDARISRIYAQRCHGIQVPIMEVSRIYKAGETALLSGGDDKAIGDALFQAAQAVRAN